MLASQPATMKITSKIILFIGALKALSLFVEADSVRGIVACRTSFGDALGILIASFRFSLDDD